MRSPRGWEVLRGTSSVHVDIAPLAVLGALPVAPAVTDALDTPAVAVLVSAGSGNVDAAELAAGFDLGSLGAGGRRGGDEGEGGHEGGEDSGRCGEHGDAGWFLRWAR